MLQSIRECDSYLKTRSKMVYDRRPSVKELEPLVPGEQVRLPDLKRQGTIQETVKYASFALFMKFLCSMMVSFVLKVFFTADVFKFTLPRPCGDKGVAKEKLRTLLILGRVIGWLQKLSKPSLLQLLKEVGVEVTDGDPIDDLRVMARAATICTITSDVILQICQ
ncbi:hypothetical protein PR048_005615 [Dryococelus australis]|uniref:Uncharacterized protein n=1 Tax=Dryococelus australis TaxID=614101 RepID=A0ABQ9I9R2_9NEOP|nr:hypothetical protein PR048_005615 [Dryococelus australis]